MLEGVTNWAEIDLDAIKFNVQQIKKHIPSRRTSSACIIRSLNLFLPIRSMMGRLTSANIQKYRCRLSSFQCVKYEQAPA